MKQCNKHGNYCHIVKVSSDIDKGGVHSAQEMSFVRVIVKSLAFTNEREENV